MENTVWSLVKFYNDDGCYLVPTSLTHDLYRSRESAIEALKIKAKDHFIETIQWTVNEMALIEKENHTINNDGSPLTLEYYLVIEGTFPNGGKYSSNIYSIQRYTIVS